MRRASDPAQRRTALAERRSIGLLAIRVNGPWRIVFRFDDGDAFEVEIVDGFALEPVHPGEVLQEELVARGLTTKALALKLGVPATA